MPKETYATITNAANFRHLTDGLRPGDVGKYLVRDAQRVIESIEALVRIHNAQEEDIYEHATHSL
jgi:hypothetical protein